jgi:hypothetical protein
VVLLLIRDIQEKTRSPGSRICNFYGFSFPFQAVAELLLSSDIFLAIPLKLDFLLFGKIQAH